LLRGRSDNALWLLSLHGARRSAGRRRSAPAREPRRRRSAHAAHQRRAAVEGHRAGRARSHGTTLSGQSGAHAGLSGCLLALEPQLLVGRRVWVTGDQREAGLRHTWPVAVEERELPDRRHHRALVDHLLDAMEDRLALLRSRLARLLADEALQLRIPAVREGAARGHEGVQARGGVAGGAAGGLDDVLELLVAILRDERRALERPQLRSDPDSVQIVHHRLAEIRVRGVAVIV